MGYFSWKTADTKEAILIDNKKPVYLLQPNGKPPIRQDVYLGYGIFGGVDAFDWLADINIPRELLDKAEKTGIEKRVVGIYLDSHYYIDTRTGKKYSYELSEIMDGVLPFPSEHGGKGNYDWDEDDE